MRYIFILLALLCASCGTALPTIKPYKLDVQQGNVVTSKMLLQLRPGMTKSQVRFIMGTPLIQDSFHGNRWDYVYQMREAGKLKEQRRVILDFENELLKSVRGDVIPAGSDQSKAGEAEGPVGTRVVTPIKKPEEKGLLNKLKFWEKDDAELAKEAAEKEAAAKAKLDAKEAAGKAAEKSMRESAPPVVEEQKSPPVLPAADPAISQQAPVEVSTPVVEPAVAQPVAPTPVEVQPAAAEPVASPAQPVEPPVKPQYYEPSSGMQFDRKLQTEVEEVEHAHEPAQVQPRAGNKVPPKPKELPPESSSSFFDRMLEQIGF